MATINKNKVPYTISGGMGSSGRPQMTDLSPFTESMRNAIPGQAPAPYDIPNSVFDMTKIDPTQIPARNPDEILAEVGLTPPGAPPPGSGFLTPARDNRLGSSAFGGGQAGHAPNLTPPSEAGNDFDWDKVGSDAAMIAKILTRTMGYETGAKGAAKGAKSAIRKIGSRYR